MTTKMIKSIHFSGTSLQLLQTKRPLMVSNIIILHLHIDSKRQNRKNLLFDKEDAVAHGECQTVC